MMQGGSKMSGIDVEFQSQRIVRGFIGMRSRLETLQLRDEAL